MFYDCVVQQLRRRESGGKSSKVESIEKTEDMTGKISFWTWDTAGPYLAKRFKDQYPNIEVDVTVVPDYYTKIIQVLATGVDVPDVMMVESFFYGVMANNIVLENLEDKPYNTTELKD